MTKINKRNEGLRVPTSWVLVAFTLVCWTYAVGQENILYRFTGGLDGGIPYAGVTFDTAGNFYGATTYGDFFGGTIFEGMRTAGGRWTGKLLYTFTGGNDGGSPEANLVLDKSGNVYGTAASDGAYGYGTVFELIPNGNGKWTFKLIYTFKGSSSGDGAYPWGGVILDSAGNLYGATQLGGSANVGTVYKLIRTSQGWQETLLYAFTGVNGDGAGGSGGLAFDGSGNLYGTTDEGGINNQGTVYQLQPTPQGSWSESVLYRFTGGEDGGSPSAGVILDKNGNLYGNAVYGGSTGYGAVYEVSHSPAGWTETVLNSVGGFPGGRLLFDSEGNLYGTTSVGGDYAEGTVFELTPASDAWNLTTLYTFTGNTNGHTRKDGADPLGGVSADSSGNLYGTTSMGGYGPCWGGLGCGIIFEIPH